MNRRGNEGQVLPIFALILTVLLGFAALVVDIGSKYSAERRYQAVADAAALAGAQEVRPVSRSAPVTPEQKDRARSLALNAVVRELLPAGAVAACDPSADIHDCPLPGGRFRVSILTPSHNCIDCLKERAVQVTVSEPAHENGFARVFGQPTWHLSRTSVAGLSFGRSYAIVTLRPIRPRSGSSVEVRDIRLDGGTQVNVFQGDVGTNANMDYSSCSSRMNLEAGYRMYHYDATPAWCTEPPGTRIGTLIEDPHYPIPPEPAVPTSPNPVDAATNAGCGTVLNDLLTQARFAQYVPLVPTVPSTGAPDPSKVKCYRPGSYAAEVKDANGELTILGPGLYYFKGGLDIQSTIIGGYDPAVSGVTLWFPRDKWFKQRNGAVVLNAGTKFRNPAGSEPATAPGMTGTVPDAKLTLIVQPDPDCVPVLPYPSGCHDPGSGGGSSANEAIDLAGGAGIYLGGVQYMPSDNVTITGNASSEGYLGQIWAWTLYYKGNNTVINQRGLGTEGPGRIRIDTACSPGAACEP